MKEVFRKVSSKVSYVAGTAYTFFLAALVIAVWGVTGPAFGFSDTWQLVINTGTTIVTFLMVFLIQNTQNRDGKAVQLKLDELIRATKARDLFIDLEDLNDNDLAELDAEFKVLHEAQSTSRSMKLLHKKVLLAQENRNKHLDIMHLRRDQ